MIKIEVGGIYRAIPMDPGDHPALVLVTAVDDSTRSLSVTLLSPDVELGTSVDLLLPPSETGLTYPVLAESDIFGYLWFVQFDRALGRVHDGVLQALRSLRDDDVVGHEVAGPPLVERSDPRWNFKLRELARLQKLTAHCTRELVDGERIASVDPRAFEAPKTDAEILAFEEFIVALIDGARSGAVVIPGWLIDIALDEDLVNAFRAVGLYNSLRLVWQLAETAGTSPDLASVAGCLTLDDLFYLQVEHSRAVGSTNQRLVTRTTATSGPIEAYPERTQDGRLVQISPVEPRRDISNKERVAA